jgi:hypothetical protein
MKHMKITIEIGPNRISKTLSRLRGSIIGAKRGLVTGWKEFDRKPASPVKSAKAA